MTKKDSMDIAIRKLPEGTSTRKIIEEADRIYNVHNSTGARDVKSIGTGRDKYMSYTAKADSSSLINPCLTTVNNLTAPVLQKLATETVGEFLPDIWSSLGANSFERALVIRVYEEMRSKILRNAFKM